MNILCFIDNLNAGGAQRQICYLASFLKTQNNQVTILTYHPGDFFLDELKKNKIHYVNIQNKNKFKRIIKIINFLRSSKYDVVITYLRTPSVISEMASIFGKKWKLIVSERNNYLNDNYFNNFLMRFMHIFADHVIVNSNTGLNSIKKYSPWLKKVSLIHNFTDLDYFKPKKIFLEKNVKKINFIGVGKYSEQKNVINLIEAFKIVKEKAPNINFNIEWFGDNFSNNQSNKYLNRIRSLINQYNLDDVFILNPETHDILDKYQRSSVFILPSLYEGFPNVVCEAIACGLPVLASEVCDNSFFVDHSNGYLFNPNDPSDIADKIISFSQLEDKRKYLLSVNSRKKAELIFSKEKFINNHLKIINKFR
ncbi:glycosyltransferase [Candidatus Pelagibacter sp. HIMB1623]|uniref:glycosyltransferase n=1 Tax=Candidatus Pelagibacter sp. HIMB1623 TaxID=3413358 RepID=UPI003F860541